VKIHENQFVVVNIEVKMDKKCKKKFTRSWFKLIKIKGGTIENKEIRKNIVVMPIKKYVPIGLLDLEMNGE